VPLGTIFQPYYKSGRKSITKCELKDVVNSKTSKYCLVSQQADTDGEVETMLYKVSDDASFIFKESDYKVR
jgi:kinesin family member 23